MRKYNLYKDSGIEWIGEIPSHWKVERFGYLFSFSRGLGITKQDLKNEGIPCVNYGEIHSKYGFALNPEIHQLKFVEESYLETADKSLLRRGDFVFADTSEDIEGSGNFTVLDSDIPTFAGYHTVIARHENDNNYKYLAYCFDSLEFRNQIRNAVSGIKVYSITQAILKSLKVQLPTFPEQTAIATYLDSKTVEIDELIANKKRLLELYEEEKTAIINKAVTKGLNRRFDGLNDDADANFAPSETSKSRKSQNQKNQRFRHSGIEWLGEIPEHWEVKRFDYLFDFSRGLPITKADLRDSGIPCVSYGEIHSKFGFEVDPNRHLLKCVDEKYLETNDKSLLKSGDFVFADTSEDLEGSGNFTYLNSSVPTFAGYHTIIGKPIIEFERRYIAYYFNTLSFRNQIRSKVTGTKVFSITQAILKFTNIIFPPIYEQQAIVDFIDNECDRINAKKAKTKKLIELLTEYRTALISEVVTGKVKVL